MVASTAACLAAGRFGLAPTVNKAASAGLKLQQVDSGLKTGDPAGAAHAPLFHPLVHAVIAVTRHFRCSSPERPKMDARMLMH
jgi:photosystem I reaction center PsaK